MDVVYKGNRKRRIKKEVLIALIFIGALLIGAGVYWLVRQRVASQQEAGETCIDGVSLISSQVQCNDGCTKECQRCRDNSGRTWYYCLADTSSELPDELGTDQQQQADQQGDQQAQGSDQYANCIRNSYYDCECVCKTQGKKLGEKGGYVENPEACQCAELSEQSSTGTGDTVSTEQSVSTTGVGDDGGSDSSPTRNPYCSDGYPYPKCYTTNEGYCKKRGFAPNNRVDCDGDGTNETLVCCPDVSSTSGGGGTSSSPSTQQAQSCDPNYVIPVSIKSFTQTSGICLQGQTYEAGYTIVIEAGAAANECGGGHYRLKLVFPSTFGSGFVKSASPSYTVSNGTIEWWTYTYDNNSITHNATISVSKNNITSPSFQVAAVLEAGDHVSVSNGTRSLTSDSQGCYTTSSTTSEGTSGSTTYTPTPTYNTSNVNTTPPPTPQGVASSLLGVFAGISLITLGVLDQQYEFVSRLFKKEHVV